MSGIYHQNKEWANVTTPNPQESATEQLETLGIDGDVYAVTDADAVHSADVGVANGIAELDANGKVPASQLPSYVDDVIEAYYDSVSDRFYEESTFTTVIPPESGKTWVDIPANKSYRWTGSVYVRTDEGVQLGETSDTAYRGDRGKIAYDHSQSDHSGIKPAFTEASTRANIASGETIATIFGKIKKFFSDLKAVAFSGSYNDLSDKPTIPTVNDATLTIQKNGTAVETFTANSSTNKTANITVPTKVSDLTDDVVSGHYLPLTGGTLTGNLNVSSSSDTPLYVRGNSQGAYIGFHNANGGTTYGYYGVRNDNKPYFYSGTGKRIVLDDELPTKLSDLTNDLNKIKDIGNSTDTTFAFSKTGLGYNDYTWLAGWNGYELRAVGKTQFAQNYVEGRLSNSDAYNALGHGYYGGNAGSIWRIAFPDATVNVWNMINMTVSIRQTWNPPRGGKVMIHAYHNATSPYTWQGLKAEVSGSLTNDIKVYASDGKYIYIAGFSGGYTTLNIDDLLIGDQSRSQDFKGTVIDMVSELPTTYQIASMKYAFYNTGGLLADGATNTPLSIQSYNSTQAWISFRDSNGNIMGYYGVNNNKPVFWDTAEREVITSATIGSQSVDKATKDGDGNTISSTYWKKSEKPQTGYCGSGTATAVATGYRDIISITIDKLGIYMLTAWCEIDGGNGNKAVLITDGNNTAYAQNWRNESLSAGYPVQYVCHYLLSLTSDSSIPKTIKARVYTTYNNSSSIKGGITAVRVL